MKIVDWFMTKGQREDDVARQLREEMRQETERCKKEVKEVRDELKLVEEELDKWKERYYELLGERFKITEVNNNEPV